MHRKPSSKLSPWRLVLGVYVLLLLASHTWRGYYPDGFLPEPGQETVRLNQVEGDSVLRGKTTRLAYTDRYNGSRVDPPVLLLLHGSPVGSRFLPALVEELAVDFRIVIPDFPGYNASDDPLPDYSMKAYAVYMHQLIDSLEIDQVHIAGFSMGSGIATYISHLYSEKTASLIMMSGLGVQELELMGSYHLNHFIHGAQLALLWVVYEGVPHFGLLNSTAVNIPYARSYYQSDQRPLRRHLKEYRKPMLIVHGSEDPLIPLAAAQEHHRIIPQSRLVLYDQGGATLLSKPQKLASDIREHIYSVVNGSARDYSDASAERIHEADRPFEDVNFARLEGVTLFILLLIIMVSTVFSEDLTCIGAGLLAARGIVGFWPATTACFAGIFIFDVGSYLLAKKIGRPALDMIPFKWVITEEDLEKTADWFKSRGPVIIIASRFIPGSRFPTYVSAGIIGTGPRRFLSFFVISLLIWTPLIVAVSMAMGTELLVYFEVYQDYAVWVLTASILLLFLCVRFLIPRLLNWKGELLNSGRPK